MSVSLLEAIEPGVIHGQEMYLLGLEYAKRMIELDKELGNDDALEYIKKNIQETEKIIEKRKQSNA